MKRFFLTLLLAVGLGVPAMGALPPFTLQGGLQVNGSSTFLGTVTNGNMVVATNIVTLTHGGVSTTYAHPTNAFASWASGDTVTIGAGTFVCSNAFKMPVGTKIQGAGRNATVLIDAFTNGIPTPLFAPSDNCAIEGLTISNLYGDSLVSGIPAACIGAHCNNGDVGFTNFFGNDLLLFGGSDTLYHRTTNNVSNKGVYWNSEIHGGWDIFTAFSLNSFSTNDFDFHNCAFIHSPTVQHGNDSDIIVSDAGGVMHLRLYNCTLITTNAAGIGTYVVTWEQSTPGSVEFHGCMIVHKAPGDAGLGGYKVQDATKQSILFAQTEVDLLDISDGLGQVTFQKFARVVTTNLTFGGDATVLGPQITTDETLTKMFFNSPLVGNGSGLTNLNPVNISSNLPLSKIAQSGASSGQVAEWNGSAWIAANIQGITIPNTITPTNFVLNQKYTNTSGSIQFIDATVALTTAAVAGQASLSLYADQSGGTAFAIQDQAKITTLLTGLAVTDTRNLIGALSNNAAYYFTNDSTGAGNSSAIAASTGELVTIGDGAAAGVSTLSGANAFSGANTFSGPSRMDNLIVTNGLTNSSLGANLFISADANGKLVTSGNAGITGTVTKYNGDTLAGNGLGTVVVSFTTNTTLTIATNTYYTATASGMFIWSAYSLSQGTGGSATIDAEWADDFGFQTNTGSLSPTSSGTRLLQNRVPIWMTNGAAFKFGVTSTVVGTNIIHWQLLRL